MLKNKFFIATTLLILVACQSPQKFSSREPAQNNRGNGEVGSVAATYLTCVSIDKKDQYRISVEDDGKDVLVNLAKDSNEIDSRIVSSLTWRQLANEEIPFEIAFSAYSISLKRLYRPGSSYLNGEIRSHLAPKRIVCDEPRKFSQFSPSPRNPAQSPQGNGEVGSVEKNECLVKKGKIRCDNEEGTNVMTCTRSLILQNSLGEKQVKSLSGFTIGETGDVGGFFYYKKFDKDGLKERIDFESSLYSNCRKN